MSNNGIAVRQQPQDTSIAEEVIVKGDLERLSPEHRAAYYLRVCESMGLNPLTQPLLYVKLNNRLTLYVTRGATDQLRAIHRIEVQITARERVDDLYVVTAEGRTRDGRTDSEIGAVSVAGLKGEALANAMMKASTKAKRRLTLSLVGTGLLDESEVETIPGTRLVEVDADGVIIEEQPAALASGEDEAVRAPAPKDAPPTWCVECGDFTRKEREAKDGSGRRGWVCERNARHPWEEIN